MWELANFVIHRGSKTSKYRERRHGDTSARQSREISKSILLALMSRDADRLLAYGEIPARCVAKVDCRVAYPDSEYVPEYY